MENRPIIIVSVGGSLIVPDQIDTQFLSNFRDLLLTFRDRYRFIIITGGGKTARRYQEAASKVVNVPIDDTDWLGIHATRLNGHLLRTVFRTEAHPRIITNPHEDIYFTEDILIAAGWRPGCSTDYDAVLIAKQMGATKMINLSNIDYVYDSDPKKNPDAKKIEKISWADFRKIIPKEWSPGLSSPFDPIAAKESEAMNLEVAIINGEKLERLADYLNEKEFVGTVIK